MKRRIYLDNAANTPLGKEAAKAMKPFLSPGFCGNSHSAHEYGARADAAIWEARRKIAKALAVKPEEVYFTSGATESNNWAIKSLALAELEKPEGKRRMRILCSAIEHASALNACRSLEGLGFEVELIQPDRNGRIAARSVSKALRRKGAAKPLLVCCMAVNNETGVANPVEEIASIAHKSGALMVSDFTQAMLYGGGTIRIGTGFPHVDYASFSSHKIYGPTGVGCLIARSGVPLSPLLSGGTQEAGKRGGTHNTAGIVGMAAAVEAIASEDMSAHFEGLYAALLGMLPQGYRLNAVPDHKNIVSLSCRGAVSVPSVALALSNMGIACTAGSACSVGEGGETETSHVLLAMGIPKEEADATARISFSRETTKRDVAALAEALAALSACYPQESGGKEDLQ